VSELFVCHCPKPLQDRYFSIHLDCIRTRNYLRVVTEFAEYFGKSPDKLGPNELRTYQAYLLTKRKLMPGTEVNCVARYDSFSSRRSSATSFAISCPTPRTCAAGYFAIIGGLKR
jgi:integrase-like protein